MPLYSIRWQNFRGFSDTGWLDLKPLTFLVGANASGKTSLLAPLLLLKQTMDAWDARLALKTKGRLLNAGTYEDLIHLHETKRHLILAFAFLERMPPEDRELPPRSVPPGVLELEYAYAGPTSPPSLETFTVLDRLGRLMLRRAHLPGAKYSVEGLELGDPNSIWAELIRNSQPDKFLFNSEGVFDSYTEVSRRRAEARRSSKEKKDRQLENIQPVHHEYMSTVDHTSSRVTQSLKELAYIGPLRERPRRIYETGGEVPFSVGPTGSYAPEIIYRAEEPALNPWINEWIQRFGFGTALECQELSRGVFRLILERENGTAVNVADTGFGLSQILPLVVQGKQSAKDDVIVAEQPEIHLNPKLQSVLADLFAAIAGRGVRVVLETHSEHLLLRIRRLIAEKRIKSSDVGLYFTEVRNGGCHVRQIPIEENGNITAVEWPKDFFADSLKESLALATAQAKGAKSAKRSSG